MATKKQKRAAALAKREEYLEGIRREGLEAQKADRDRREAESKAWQEHMDVINERHRDILARHGIHE